MLVGQRAQTRRPALHPQPALEASRSFPGDGRTGERARGMDAAKDSRARIPAPGFAGSPATACKPRARPDGSPSVSCFCAIPSPASGSPRICPGPRQAGWDGGGSARVGRSPDPPPKGSLIPSCPTQLGSPAGSPGPLPSGEAGVETRASDAPAEAESWRAWPAAGGSGMDAMGGSTSRQRQLGGHRLTGGFSPRR